jgi:hypothetical protein
MFSCTNQTETDTTENSDSSTTTVEENQNSNQDEGEPKVQLNEDVINNIIQSIPSPLETTVLIKEVGSEYLRKDLSNPDNVDNYTTSYAQALNLGVYSMNLGYANIYGKNQDILKYLNSIKKLADQLNIGQFFDYNTLKKLTSSSENLDSLLQLSTSNFEKINYHLRQQKREYLSILILTGGWLEATNVTSLIYKESGNKVLKERLGEQKIVLERILLVLEIYKTKPKFSELIADLKELKKAYDSVEIIIERSDPIMKVEGDQIIIESQDKMVINITDEEIDTIINLLGSIRGKIVN